MDFIESSLKQILVEDFGVTYQDIEKARNRKYFLSEICMDSLDEMQLEATLERVFDIYLKKPNELHKYSFPEIVESIENYCRANVNNVQKNCNSKSNSHIHEDMQENNTDKPYWDFFKRKLYENFNKLR